MQVLICLTLLSITFLVSAASTAEPAATQPIQKAVFYQIGKSGQVSYILGTVHLQVKIEDLPREVNQKILSARVILVEEQVPAAIVNRFFKDRLGLTLDRARFNGVDLSDVERERLVKVWNVPAPLAERAASTNCFLLSYSSPGQDIVMDYQIQMIANDRSIPVVSLDDVELITRTRTAVRKLRPDCDLRNALRADPHAVWKEDQDLVDAYRRADVAALASGSNDPAIVIRNGGWMPKIEAELAAGNAFIAVGSGHLYGTKGLLSKLKAAGYSVRPAIQRRAL